VFSSASPPLLPKDPMVGVRVLLTRQQSDTTVLPGANVERVAGKGIVFDCTRRRPNPDGLHAKGLGKQVGTLCASERGRKNRSTRDFSLPLLLPATTAAALLESRSKGFLHNDNTTMSLFNFSGGGDIWSSAGFAFVSPINDILDKDSFTLEEILAQDEVLQEVKSLNIKLVDFLSKESSVRDMMTYLADPPPEGAPDNRVFKFPYMSCEIICCEVPEILKAIANDGASGGDDCPLRKLFSILDGEGDIDSHRAGYLEKASRRHSSTRRGYRSVLTVLLKHRCGATTAFVNEGGLDLFRRMVRHLGNFSVMQVAKLLLLPKYAALQDIDATALMGDGRGVGGSEDDGGPPASLWCNWSDNPEILKTLLAEFNRQPIGGEGVSGDAEGEGGGGGDGGGEAEGGQEKREESGESSDMHLHLSELLLALIAQSSPESSFLQRIFSEEAVAPLVAAATLTKDQGRQAEGSQAALQILAALADRLVQPLPPSMSPLANENTEMQMDLTEGFGVGGIGDGATEGGQGAGIAAGGLRPPEFLKVDGAVLERGLSDLVPSLCAYLRGHTEDPSTITAQTKQEQPRLGLLRLQVVRFLETLVRMDSAVIDQVLIRENAMATCLEMMFTYETSSMLHASVATSVQAILAPPVGGGAPGISRVGLGAGGGLSSPTSTSSEAAVAGEGEGEGAGDRKEGSPAEGVDSAVGGAGGGGGGGGDGMSNAGRGRRESFQRHLFEDCRLVERILEAVALNEDAEKPQQEQAPMEESETEPAAEAAAEAAEGGVTAAGAEGGGAGAGGDGGGDGDDGELADAAAPATPEQGQTTGGEDAGVEAVASATAAAETAMAEAPEAVAGAAGEAPAEEGDSPGEKAGTAAGGDDATAVAADSAAAGGSSSGGGGTGAGRRRSRPGRRLGHMGHVLLLSRAVMGAESGGGEQGVASPRPSLAAEGGMLEEGGDGGDAASAAAAAVGEGEDSGGAAAGDSTAPGKKTFVGGLLAKRDCAEHWQELVRTTVAEEVSRQMNPLGGFAVPSREDENQLSSDFPDEAVDMDDTSGLLENMTRMQTAASGAGEDGGVGGLPPAPKGSYVDDDDDDDEEFGTGGGGSGGGSGGSNVGGGGDSTNSLAMMFGSNFMSAAGGGSAWGSLAGEPGSSTATGAGSIGGSAFGSTAGDSSASVAEGWANFADFGDVQQSAGVGGGGSGGSGGAAGGGGFANFDPVFAIDAPAPPGPSGFAPSPPSWAPRVGDSGAIGDGGSGAGSSGGEGGFADFPQYGGFADFSAMMDDTLPSPPEPPAAASPAFDGGSGGRGGGGGGGGDGSAGGEDRMDEEAEDREDGAGVSSLGTAEAAAAAAAAVAGVGLSMSTSPRENKCDSLDAMMGSDDEEEEKEDQQQQREGDGAGAGEQRS
ncbi:unnamed protein product, partial [Ectocarpus fasciculatus]